jgi:hypothetical protein
LSATTVVRMGEPRYRCDGCGNLTRFDVTTSQTTKAFHHYTVGGELEVEDATVLSHHVDEVVCRWCGHGRSVVELGEDEPGAGGEGAGGAGAAGEDARTDGEREPGAQSRIA